MRQERPIEIMVVGVTSLHLGGRVLFAGEDSEELRERD